MPLRSIHLLSERENVTAAELLELSSGQVIACDCYVQGAESWQPVIGGYDEGRIVNVDHHADTQEMAREVSSANLALERVRALGLPPANARIVITHTDCDSILTAGIMSGRLAADDRYGDAAIAADHTGAENAIADLLQALDKSRDVELSFEALARLEAGLPQSSFVEDKLAERRGKRAAATALVRGGGVAMQGNIAVGLLANAIDGEFFAPLLPDAVVIVLASPHRDNTSRLEVKVRRGTAAAARLSLHALAIRDFDPAYGGRWNAGSDNRGGGTSLALDDYVARLRTALDARLHDLQHGAPSTGK